MSYQYEYLYNPGDVIWIPNKQKMTITKASVKLIEVKLYNSINIQLDQLRYTVEFQDKSLHIFKEEELYATFQYAYDYLFNSITIPTPTPYTSSTPVPSVTPISSSTPGISATPSASHTPVVTISVTPPPSNTIGVSPTPTPSVSVSATSINIPELLFISKINSTHHNMVKGQPVSLLPNGHLVLADNLNAKHFLGFVLDDIIAPNSYGRILIEGSLTNSYWDQITGSINLTLGMSYYLTDIPGIISTSQPTFGFVKEVAYAVNNNILDLRNGPVIRLS